jgi:hypothetical protein
MNDSTVQQASSPAREVVTAEPLWGALSSRRVYFAHQSVGGNLVAGIEDLIAAGKAPGLAIVQTREPRVVTGGAFVHFVAGRNQDPASKNADFIKILDARPDRDGGIALLKYCYVDMTEQTDVAALFQAYRDMVATIRQRHPDLTVAHVTMPLTADEGGARALAKRLLGRPAVRGLNAKRNQFNALLRQAYQGEVLFDLAQLESTRSDGSRESTMVGSDTVYALAPSYTYDGGHLNEYARRTFAAKLLAQLAAAPRQQ